MQRPVWLFSMDSEQFHAPPTTCGALQAFYLQYGTNADTTEFTLVHFRDDDSITDWLSDSDESIKAVARSTQQPVFGFSFYTWNAAEFLHLVCELKERCPNAIIVAGGPHVQQAEDYLFDDPIDVVILGEGEITFTELLDCSNRSTWQEINGLAFLQDGHLTKTPPRERTRDMSLFPSALEVIDLVDGNGKPLYESISYETCRGCPFKCAFCEWGTGDLGSKMYQHSMERIRSDWEIITTAGIKDLWLADSNFGALKADLKKAQLIVELKEKTGLPQSFATSWSKKHNPRVQEIVLLLHQHELLPHYQLALQTLTPLALEQSNRKNMNSNDYEPIAKTMSEQGVPIAAELIWGLPGDNLSSFESNLDTLLATFPNINIFGYTLLPGTEFYERRHEYQIEAIPVAGYGKAKGEYVVGCHSFDRNEGEEGYFLISAHLLLIHGHMLPLTTRFLALCSNLPVSKMLRRMLAAILNQYANSLDLDASDRMLVYEQRNTIYLAALTDREHCYVLIKNVLTTWLRENNVDTEFCNRVLQVLDLDRELCPRSGQRITIERNFDFDAPQVLRSLDAMEAPDVQAFNTVAKSVTIDVPGGLGTVLTVADGGSWISGSMTAIDELKSVQTLRIIQPPEPQSAT